MNLLTVHLQRNGNISLYVVTMVSKPNQLDVGGRGNKIKGNAWILVPMLNQPFHSSMSTSLSLLLTMCREKREERLPDVHSSETEWGETWKRGTSRVKCGGRKAWGGEEVGREFGVVFWCLSLRRTSPPVGAHIPAHSRDPSDKAWWEGQELTLALPVNGRSLWKKLQGTHTHMCMIQEDTRNTHAWPVCTHIHTHQHIQKNTHYTLGNGSCQFSS